MKEKINTFRKLIHSKKILIAPGAYNCLTAKIIEKVGFDAVYITGSGLSFTILGEPDIGLMTLTEVKNQVENIVNCMNLPVIVDIDTGFGNALNVIRTIKIFKKMGVVAVQLEDQVFPKKCGHYLGKKLISIDEMVGKIKAAKIYSEGDMLLIARTDARTPFGIEEAIKRAKIYEEAGADIIFVESPESVEEMKKINFSIKAPTLVNIVEGGRTPILSSKELEKLGYNIVIFPNTITRTVLKAVTENMQELKEKGSTKDLVGNKMVDFKTLHEFFGLSKVKKIESKFIKGL